MKLTYEQKVKAYKDWKGNLKSPGIIARELCVNVDVVRYFLRLADRHGIEILKHSNNKYYSPEEKLRIINRVLISNESIKSVSIDEGLSRDSLLIAWIKSYKENKYNVIENKRGRKLNDKEEDNTGATSREQSIEREDVETRSRKLILKKIGCLNSGKRTARKEEIAQAVSELRQELKCSLKFILDVIKANPSLPQITKSDYYYQISKVDKDLKNDEIMNKIIETYYRHKRRYGYRRITVQ